MAFLEGIRVQNYRALRDVTLETLPLAQSSLTADT